MVFFPPLFRFYLQLPRPHHLRLSARNTSFLCSPSPASSRRGRTRDSKKSGSFTRRARKVAACRRASPVGRSEIFRSSFVSSVSEVVIGFSSLLLATPSKSSVLIPLLSPLPLL